MEQSDDEDKSKVPEQASLIEEALKILNEEGFALPNDVVDTLETVGRSNARRRGPPLRSHRVCEVQSNTRRQRNAREATRRGSQSDASSDEGTPMPERPRNTDSQGATAASMARASNEMDSASSRGPNQDNEFSSEASSTCTGSTVREFKDDRVPFTRQDSGSSIASSASSFNRKLAQLDDGRSSHGSDTGYNTSLENAAQVHEARADNLKNYTKHMEKKLSEKERFNNGLRRDLSRDSGFTEMGDAASGYERTPQTVSPVGNDTKDFRDTSISNSDIKERIISTESGAAHQVTSSASNLTAAEMTQRSSNITDDGTAVSTAAKLENQECTSSLSKATDKIMADQVSKEEEHQTENRRTKSSRNDSISTTASGVTTAASRHAVSMDQELNKEKAAITASADGRNMASTMEMTQQLSREQEMNNIEQSDDGSSKAENKKVSEKAAMSKTHREEQMTSEDGLTSGVISGSQHQETNAKASQSEESTTSPDGSVSKRKQDSSSSSQSQHSSTEQKTVKQLPYGGGSSSELVKKSDSSSVSKSSSTVNQVTEGRGGRSQLSKTEDSNSASSSFSGLCESTDEVNDMKIHRTKSSEQSSESNMKSSKASSSYSNKSNDSFDDRSFNRRLSNGSNASTLSNISGLSRENIKPPSYEETVNNLSRQSSVLSRQDSCGSSIASSASALNEQMRQKRLAEAETESRASLDSQTRLKQVVDSSFDRKYPAYARQGSHSSDSTLSGGVTNNVYENVDGADYFDGMSTSHRVISHPIRKVEAYTRSSTDPTLKDRTPNRRYTLHGDVVLSDRELREAREEVRSKVRGRDDIYLGSRSEDSSSERSFGSSERRSKSSRRREGSSFEREVMELVDKFFDEDDGFGFGFSSARRPAARDYTRRITSPELNMDYRPSSSRTHQNPYSTRADLSAFAAREDASSSRHSSEYAASDSGFPTSRRYGGGLHSLRDEGPILDSASDSGHHRLSRPRDSRQDRFIPGDSYAHEVGSPRRRSDNQYQFSDSDSRHKSYSSAGDNLQRAGKSMNGDKHISSSISEGNRRNDFTRTDQVRNSSYVSDGNIYKRYADDAMSDRFESDVSDSSSTCPSFRSLPPDAYRMNQFDPEDFRTQSLPDITDGKLPKDDPRWGNRKERIDTALSWIRSELGHLRTQDKVLMSQFQRCQDSIEQLKKQRPWYDVASDEEGEDGRHWEDWEIEDFDRSCENERERESPRKLATEPKEMVITKEYQRMSIKSKK